MVVLWLVLLAVLGTFFLGVAVWAVCEHFLTTDVPSALRHPAKFRFLHCIFIYVITLGNIFEKIGACSLPRFLQFLHNSMRIKEDPALVVTNLRFGTIPVRLFQPKAPSPSPRRGIIFFHGGGALIGSLDMYHSLCGSLARETDSVLLAVGYRKLPDHHYSTVYHDCLNASIHFLKTLETYGVDSSRVVLCGDSSGAGAAALISQTLVGRLDLPQIRAQVLIYPLLQLINFQLPSFHQNSRIPFLTQKLLITCMFKYLLIDFSWRDAIVSGAFIPPEVWKKYRKWLSTDNLPNRFKKTSCQPVFPAPFNEAAYLESEHLLDAENSPLVRDDEIIAQLPEAFLVSCENDILRDDALLYKKRLEDRGVPVTWYHVEDGFHGSLMFFDKKLFSFPCSLKIMNAVVSYIKSIL
ncbi:arylacetamide deacetylase-like 4 [Moschus berezovskii]|uniref:arylacetamide deacetylase-like 4 n=1 Tax=Moschus berezovskii TaxID=68408 RepID=UPI0024441608|nr:arylacetamide deacetylase-like 4 [Moschus berezovskii]